MSGVYGLLWIQKLSLWRRCSRKIILFCCVLLLALSFIAGRFSHPLVHLSFAVTDPRLEQYATLHDELKRLLDISRDKTLFVQSGIGPLVSLRENRYSLFAHNDLKRDYSGCYVAISHLCGVYSFENYEVLKNGLDKNDTLELVSDSGVLRIYRGK